MKLSELARALSLSFSGVDCDVSGLNSLEDASETEISFFTNPKYARFAKETRACAVLVTADLADSVPNALVSLNPYFDFARAGAIFARKEGEFSGISPLAYVDASAILEENVTVYPFAFVGPRVRVGKGSQIFPAAYIGEDSRLGAGCHVYPGAVILARVVLGPRCVVQPGAVVGAEGFGFVRTGAGIQKIPQTGGVVLGEGVELGANTCVDKAHIGNTTLGDFSKIDNLVQIGHNVQMGEENIIVSQVGIAGSCRIGHRVTMAGQAGIAGHLNIGDDVTIGAQAGVPQDIEAGAIGSGTPFMDKGTYARNLMLTPKIPDLFKRVRALERELADLKDIIVATSKENS